MVEEKKPVFTTTWVGIAFILQQISISLIVFVIFISMTKQSDGNFFKYILCKARVVHSGNLLQCIIH